MTTTPLLLLLCCLLGFSAPLVLSEKKDDGRRKKAPKHPIPVIFVPGFLSSSLEGTLSNAPAPSLCPRTTSGFFRLLWPAPQLFLLPSCLLYYFSLEIDEEASDNLIKKSRNPLALVQHDADGVTVRPENFGSDFTRYAFLSELVDLGYTPEVNIKGKAFDFRLTLSDLKRRGTFQELQTLVEETYEQNAQTKVALIGVSMGGLINWQFLLSMSQEWKNKYISSNISVGAPYAGFVPAISFWTGGSVAISAEMLPIPFIGSISAEMVPIPFIGNILKWLNDVIEVIVFTPLLGSLGSIPQFLLPLQGEAFQSMGTLVETPSKSYSVDNLIEVFSDMNSLDQVRLYRSAQSDPLQIDDAPMVNTHIIYGAGVPTAAKLVYGEDFQPNYVPKYPAEIIYGDGDALANIESLSIAEKKWKSVHEANGFETTVLRVPGVTHFSVSGEDVVAEKVQQILGLL